ncbi:hypothetical protein HYH03_015958 [Edaphochlamys debaryana]|uniref:Pherophorin domain-containing protein n=1 Tax=Edaphochlamys debaryana TaxID=47281 RepID=A0A835XJK4_9CHLO|nr:hypothetical protein HYH03_015958 [Edaphochlamys debaryana]|eukprot:KAG2485283.1 hypothetical protein HYH03_015958 [Edaphochlamys debaryana]
MKRVLALSGLALAALLCLGALPAEARKAPKLSFPALVNCAKKADSTSFRINETVTHEPALPGTSLCFSFEVAAPKNPTGPCGKAKTLERVQFWASYENRKKITQVYIRAYPDGKIDQRKVFGAWIASGDHYVFSKLGWTADYVRDANPKLCISLEEGTSLDDLFLGAPGQATLALYSADGGQKCCPLYSVPLPADA